MTKADIINRVSEELGIDRRTVGLVIESFMKCVKDALGRERSVFLRGFGTFSLKKRAAKKAQNIQQHTTICIPARKVPHFKPSESFSVLRKEDNRKETGSESTPSIVREGWILMCFMEIYQSCFTPVFQPRSDMDYRIIDDRTIM